MCGICPCIILKRVKEKNLIVETQTNMYMIDYQAFSFLVFLQESPQDSAITRDINRTFPAHDYFKDTGGDGQDSLYKICKVFHVKNNDSVLNGRSGSLRLCKR